MFKGIQKALIFTAFTIVMLHSTVPHMHHSPDQISACQNSDEQQSSLLDFLESIFHIDFGEKHLEDFRDGSNIDALFIACEAKLELPHILVIEPKKTFAQTSTPAQASTYGSHSLRAPPYYS
jgi:hypothetical protein